MPAREILADKLVEQAATREVELKSLSRYYSQKKPMNGIVLGFAAVGSERTATRRGRVGEIAAGSVKPLWRFSSTYPPAPWGGSRRSAENPFQSADRETGGFPN